jgi:hypothetical protein
MLQNQSMESKSEFIKPEGNKPASKSEVAMPELKRIREIISDKEGKIIVCPFYTQRGNERKKELFREKLIGFGIDENESVATMLPTESRFYAQVMNPLFRARIYTKQNLIKFDLEHKHIKDIDKGGPKFKIVEALRNYLVAVDEAKAQSLANPKM